ncbi:hypothetical protein J7K27_05910, partial [Candidatus Bathyarchaeota archaeon]|nr:hypothetical protein [Candidatus Bathyarchaeota archaeon]
HYLTLPNGFSEHVFFGGSIESADCKGGKLRDLTLFVLANGFRVKKNYMLFADSFGIVEAANGLIKKTYIGVTYDVVKKHGKYYACAPGFVKIVDATTGTVEKEYTSYFLPLHLKHVPGMIIGSDAVLNEVVILRDTDLSLIGKVKNKKLSWDVCYDGSEYIYTTEVDGYIRKYTLDGELVLEKRFLGDEIEYYDGEIYTNRSEGNYIRVFDENLNKKRDIIATENDVTSFTVGEGYVFYTDYYGLIKKTDLNGNIIDTLNVGERSLILNYSNGKLIADSLYENKVHIYDTSFNKIGEIVHPYVYYPTGTTFTGSLYVVPSQAYAVLCVFDTSFNLVGLAAGNLFVSIDVSDKLIAASDQVTGYVFIFDMDLNIKSLIPLYAPSCVFYEGEKLYIADNYTGHLYVSEPPYSGVTDLGKVPTDYSVYKIKKRDGKYVATDIYYAYILSEDLSKVLEKIGYIWTDVYDQILDVEYSDGKLYILRGTKLEIFKDTNKVGEYITFCQIAHLSARLKSGINVANTTLGRLYVVDDSYKGYMVTDWVTPCVAPTYDGKALITDTTNDRLLIFDGENFTEVYKTTASSPSQNITGAIILRDGTILCYDRIKGTTWIISNGVEKVVSIPFALYACPSPDFDYFYVTTIDGVYKVNADGSAEKIISNDNLLIYLKLKNGIEAYSEGIGKMVFGNKEIYVSEPKYSVHVYTSIMRTYSLPERGLKT